MLLITLCTNYFFEDATASVKMDNKEGDLMRINIYLIILYEV